MFIRIRKTFTNIHKHNPKTLEIGSVTKIFITFLSLRFFDMRRERHTQFLCMLTFPSEPHQVRHPNANYWSGLRELQKSTSFVQDQISTNYFFFYSKILSASGHDDIHVPRSHFLSEVFIVTSLIVISAPPAREHLHSMCPPNPCTKPKGSQPN